ncbi:unnamed protein product, partial [Owenia fusiformis]
CFLSSGRDHFIEMMSPCILVLLCVSLAHAITEGDISLGVERNWIASIEYKLDSETNTCAGVLLNQRWIATSARCMDAFSITEAGDWQVTLGIRDLNDETDVQKSNIDTVVVNPDYNSNTLVGNVALIRMQEDAKFENTLIGIIEMASDANAFPDGTPCWVQGWGKLGWSELDVPWPLLQEANVHVMENTVCSQYWPNNNSSGGIAATDICTGSRAGAYPPHVTPFPSLCGLWDEGAPLSCQIGGSWQLAGLGSWHGQRCGIDNPPVYTRISSYRSWINSVISLG